MWITQIERPQSWFWGVMFSSWRIYRDVLIASLFINIFGLTTPFYILNVYDKVITNAAFRDPVGPIVRHRHYLSF